MIEIILWIAAASLCFGIYYWSTERASEATWRITNEYQLAQAEGKQPPGELPASVVAKFPRPQHQVSLLPEALSSCCPYSAN